MNGQLSNLFKIIVFVLVLLLFLALLNYLNIIPLSSILPNQLGWLPHKPYSQNNQNVPKNTQQQSQKFRSEPPIKLDHVSCPVPKEFCKSAKVILDGNNFLGIGFSLPLKTKIFAAMPGTIFSTGVEDKAKGISIHTKIILGGRGPLQGYSTTYEFFGLSASPSAQPQDITIHDIIAEKEIGSIQGGSFPKNPPFEGINLLLSVQKEGKSLKINPQDLTFSD